MLFLVIKLIQFWYNGDTKLNSTGKTWLDARQEYLQDTFQSYRSSSSAICHDQLLQK